MRKLAVLGSPIAHSKSPLLHLAAYNALGLDWSYTAIDVAEHELEAFVETLEEGWRGLSLTMPLKRAVLPLLTDVDPIVELTGVANTVVFEGKRRWGFNTDVHGLEQAFRDQGFESLARVGILGGGATAVSAVVAAHRLGAQSVAVRVRTIANASGLRDIADALGVALDIQGLDVPLGHVDAVISTLPGGVDVAPEALSAVSRTAVLLDVAYDPWPSELAGQWSAPVISGLDMLVNQAHAQVRAFVTGSPLTELDNDASVLIAMKDAIAK